MRRTFWPFGILLIIIAGILLLVGLVYISLKQVNLEDHAYLQKYRNVEENIQTMMKNSKMFLQDYEALIQTGATKQLLLPPYETLSQAMQPPLALLEVKKQNALQLQLRAKKQDSKIEILEYKIFAAHYYDRDYKDRADFVFRGEKLMQNFVFEPSSIGRWRLILEISFQIHDQKHQIYLQRDFIAKD